MGKTLFVIFPIIILVISILMQGGAITGNFDKPTCFNVGQTNCTQNANSVTYTCPGSPFHFPYVACQVSSNCSPAYPSPAYCFQGAQFINPGDTLVVNVAQTDKQGLFNFGAVGVSGFVAMISVAIAVAVLASTTIFSSGVNTEGVHILFIGGLLVGVWGFVASLEGFLSSSPTSFFTQLNLASNALQLLPFGTIGYVAISLIEMIGIMSFVSRGGST